MIWIGTGGVPICSKERSTIGGIKELAKLGLNAMERIIESMDRAEVMKADAVAVHMGFLGKLSQQESNELMKERVADVIEKMHKQGIHKVKLGPETMVKKGQWGSFE